MEVREIAREKKGKDSKHWVGVRTEKSALGIGAC